MAWLSMKTWLEVVLLNADNARLSDRDCREGVQSFVEKRPAAFAGTLADDAPRMYPWWTPVDHRSKRITLQQQIATVKTAKL